MVDTNKVGLMRKAWLASFIAATLVVTASSASAETLLMPNRDFLRNASEVVWGITTQSNGTAYTINFGDGVTASGNVADRSYIAFNHTYALAGTFTVTLSVGAESTTTTVRVFDGATLSAADLRGLNINRAIADGLRYLWTTQANRTTFDTNAITYWGGYSLSTTALVVTAFQNHGYVVPNSNATPTGIYPKYAVQRGLNYVIDYLQQVNLTAQPAGDPCVNVSDGPAPCVGLQQAYESVGYATSLAALPLASSNALARTVSGITGSQNSGYVVGKTYGEILQRVMNAQAFGQGDVYTDGNSYNGRGGWTYGFNDPFTTDGSTIGWNVLALLDAAAAGTAIPAFVKTEYQNFAYTRAIGNDGSYDYNADANPASTYLPNVARAGIGLQGLFYTGGNAGSAFGVAAQDYISDRWAGTSLAGDYNDTCGFNFLNKGCGYAMFNVFKGLKLLGVTTLPNVNRPAGSVGDPDDWYADYVDWLLANQSDPTTTSGGGWYGGVGKTAMRFSCCYGDNSANAALAELILAPVALISPDPTLFSTVGLSPASATNPVNTNHTVTATALSASKAPIPGATVDFDVLTGPNAGKSGQAVTNAAGQATFTYNGNMGVGTDTIQAFIGTLGSNVVSKTWIIPTTKCDADGDQDVDNADLLIIRNANGQLASGPTDPRDGNSDKRINVSDVRYCQLRCTSPNCAITGGTGTTSALRK
jgi:hypothetical protein